jgi:hypothetical protein
MATRSAQIHNLARELADAFDVRFEAVYGNRQTMWDLDWSNGPTVATVKQRVKTLAAGRGLNPEIFRYGRVVQPDAYAVHIVRFFRSSADSQEYWDQTSIGWAIDRSVRDTDYPERAADDREQVLAARLATAFSDEHPMTEALRERGLSWLAEDDLAQARPGDRQWAGEVLTARYAAGAHATAWR